MSSLFLRRCLPSGARQAAGRRGPNGRSVLPGAGGGSRPEEPGSGREPGPGAVREAGAGLGGGEEAADPEGGGDEGEGRGGAGAAVSGEGGRPASVETRRRSDPLNFLVVVQSDGCVFLFFFFQRSPN